MGRKNADFSSLNNPKNKPELQKPPGSKEAPPPPDGATPTGMRERHPSAREEVIHGQNK